MIRRTPEARAARIEFFSMRGKKNRVLGSRNPAANAVGAPATCEHLGGQLPAACKPSEEDSGTGERCKAQDRAKPLRLQHAIWHWGSADCASREISGAGPNSRISARPIARRMQLAACRTPFICSKYTILNTPHRSA